MGLYLTIFARVVNKDRTPFDWGLTTPLSLPQSVCCLRPRNVVEIRLFQVLGTNDDFITDGDPKRDGEGKIYA